MDGPALVSPDDVLAQPTRAQLFARLENLRRPASTAELAAFVALHPNGVRAHLERMRQAALLERRQQHRGRGRPPDTWAIAAGARPGGRAPEGYRELGRWLARALASRRRGLSGIEQTGREIGRELAPVGEGDPTHPAAGDTHAGYAEDPRTVFQTTFAALGFQPALEPSDDQAKLTVCLGNCPYRDAVRENQPAICALHKGITAGLIDQLAPRARLTAFVPHDPDQAGCRVEIAFASTTELSQAAG